MYRYVSSSELFSEIELIDVSSIFQFERRRPILEKQITRLSLIKGRSTVKFEIEFEK